MGTLMMPGARERAYREKRRLRAAVLFEQGVPNEVIGERLGVSDSAVDLWKARWEVGGAEFALDRKPRLSASARPGAGCGTGDRVGSGSARARARAGPVDTQVGQ